MMREHYRTLTACKDTKNLVNIRYLPLNKVKWVRARVNLTLFRRLI